MTGSVTAEITGTLAMPATRRLQLAAEQSRTTVLLLRRSRKQGNPTLAPSVAMSRWRVVTLPSPVPLPHSPETPGLAHACWHVDLLRCRGASSASWNVEGCDQAGRGSGQSTVGSRLGAELAGPHFQLLNPLPISAELERGAEPGGASARRTPTGAVRPPGCPGHTQTEDWRA